MKTKIIFAVLCLLTMGCSTHYLNKDDLVQQVQESGRKVYLKECRNGICVMKVEKGEYPVVSNNLLDSLSKGSAGQPTLAWIEFTALKEVRCRNKDGKLVKVGVDQNSQLLMFNRSREKTQFYFKTGRYDGKAFHGLRSVILRIEREIKLDDVDSIEFYSEFKIERPIDQ